MRVLSLLSFVAGASAILKFKGDDTHYASSSEACKACAAHQSFLDDPKHIKNNASGCQCHANDINAQFENDATKKAMQIKNTSTNEGTNDASHKTDRSSKNMGAARLNPNWKWGCKAVSGTQNALDAPSWVKC